MLFNYKVSGTPSANLGDLLADIAAILGGETNVANLSSHCDQTGGSLFHANSSPLVNTFTTEFIDASKLVLYRPHPDVVATKIWSVIEVEGNDIYHRILSDGTGGTLTNKSTAEITTNLELDLDLLVTGVEFFIIANDFVWGFITTDGNRGAFSSIFPKLAVDHPLLQISDVTKTHLMQSQFGVSQLALKESRLFYHRTSVDDYYKEAISVYVNWNSSNMYNIWDSLLLDEINNNILSDDSRGLIIDPIPVYLTVNDTVLSQSSFVGSYNKVGVIRAISLDVLRGSVFTNPIVGSKPLLMIRGVKDAFNVFVEI